MMNALRLNDGFSVQEFEGRTGEPIAAVRPMLAKAEQDGLIERSLQQIKTTELGANYLDTVLQLFMESDQSTENKSGLTSIPIISEQTSGLT